MMAVEGVAYLQHLIKKLTLKMSRILTKNRQNWKNRNT